jgi:Leucine-rich repeat (LRR) protein
MQALILSSNAIPVASGISGLIQLNTLVLSKNRLESIGVSKLVYLEKLSLSHNEFRSFPDISVSWQQILFEPPFHLSLFLL